MAFVLLGSFFSYAQSGFVFITLVGYFFSLSGLFYCFLRSGFFNKEIAISVFFFFSLFSISTFISAFLNAGSSFDFLRFIQDMIYPLVALMILLTGYPTLVKSGSFLVIMILALAGLNFLFAIFGVLGLLKAAWVFGDIVQGRYIFGTNIRSSNGLMLNVNYYATAQASLGLFYLLLISIKNKIINRKDWVVFFLILLSSLLGSSRGVAFSIFLFLSSFWFLSYLSINSAYKKLLWFLFFIFSCAALMFFYLNYSKDFSNFFRLERGLNAREYIWLYAMQAWLEKPFFGWGGDSGNALGYASGGDFENRSTHSAYIHSMLRLGLFGFIVIYGGIFYFMWCSRKCIKFSIECRVAFCCVIFYLASSMFRTYSFGGVGLLPLVTAISISVLIYKSEFYRILRGSTFLK